MAATGSRKKQHPVEEDQSIVLRLLFRLSLSTGYALWIALKTVVGAVIPLFLITVILVGVFWIPLELLALCFRLRPLGDFFKVLHSVISPESSHSQLGTNTLFVFVALPVVSGPLKWACLLYWLLLNLLLTTIHDWMAQLKVRCRPITHDRQKFADANIETLSQCHQHEFERLPESVENRRRKFGFKVDERLCKNLETERDDITVSLLYRIYKKVLDSSGPWTTKTSELLVMRERFSSVVRMWARSRNRICEALYAFTKATICRRTVEPTAFLFTHDFLRSLELELVDSLTELQKNQFLHPDDICHCKVSECEWDEDVFQTLVSNLQSHLENASHRQILVSPSEQARKYFSILCVVCCLKVCRHPEERAFLRDVIRISMRWSNWRNEFLGCLVEFLRSDVGRFLNFDADHYITIAKSMFAPEELQWQVFEHAMEIQSLGICGFDVGDIFPKYWNLDLLLSVPDNTRISLLVYTAIYADCEVANSHLQRGIRELFLGLRRSLTERFNVVKTVCQQCDLTVRFLRISDSDNACCRVVNQVKTVCSDMILEGIDTISASELLEHATEPVLRSLCFTVFKQCLLSVPGSFTACPRLCFSSGSSFDPVQGTSVDYEPVELARLSDDRFLLSKIVGCTWNEGLKDDVELLAPRILSLYTSVVGQREGVNIEIFALLLESLPVEVTSRVDVTALSFLRRSTVEELLSDCKSIFELMVTNSGGEAANKVALSAFDQYCQQVPKFMSKEQFNDISVSQLCNLTTSAHGSLNTMATVLLGTLYNNLTKQCKDDYRLVPAGNLFIQKLKELHDEMPPTLSQYFHGYSSARSRCFELKLRSQSGVFNEETIRDFENHETVLESTMTTFGINYLNVKAALSSKRISELKKSLSSSKQLLEALYKVSNNASISDLIREINGVIARKDAFYKELEELVSRTLQLIETAEVRIGSSAPTEASQGFDKIPEMLSEEQRFLPEDLQYDEDKDYIGRGGFAQVYKAVDCRHGNNSFVALKKPNIGGSRLTEYDMLDLTKEAKILLNIPRHDNVVKIIGVCYHPRYYALVLEFVDGGDLHNTFRRRDPFIQPWDNRMLLAQQIANGMGHLHSLRFPVIHRDLKPQNVLVKTTSDRYVCKITDFGLSKMRETSRQTTRGSSGSFTSLAGTLVYIAPERYLRDDKRRITKNMATKLDVYSFGVILWQFREQRQPFEDEIDKVVIANVQAGVPFQKPECWCPEGYTDLTSRCCSQDPTARPAFRDLSDNLQKLAKSLAKQDRQ